MGAELPDIIPYFQTAGNPRTCRAPEHPCGGGGTDEQVILQECGPGQVEGHGPHGFLLGRLQANVRRGLVFALAAGMFVIEGTS